MRQRPARNADALAVEAPAPRLQQRGILLEFGVAPLVAKVGTDQDVAVAVAAVMTGALVETTVWIPPILLHTSQLTSKR